MDTQNQKIDRLPIVKSLDEIYTSSSAEEKRWDNLQANFREKYGAPCEWIARAPGRVNIIGDHVDYCGFPCLPAAIQPDVLIAGRSRHSTGDRSHIRLSNIDAERFPDEVIEFSKDSDLNFAEHSWGNYVKASLKGVLQAHGAKLQHFHLELLVVGNVPPGGGLSSSAAMVIASSIASSKAMDQIETIDRTQMAEIAIVSERAVGVNSGGTLRMDQTASVFGERSCLLRITFVPKLSSCSLRLPDNLAFVIANSLVTSEKQATAKSRYNLRVVEARAFTAVLARHLNIRNLPSPPTPKALIDALPASYGSGEPERLERMLQLVEKVLGQQAKGSSWQSVWEQLGVSSQQAFEQEYQQGIEIEASDLKLYKRAKHVVRLSLVHLLRRRFPEGPMQFGEALAVYRVCDLLDGVAKTSAEDEELPTQLGHLLSASQKSLRDDCQSSCKEIDDLIEIAIRSGSLGSRVTGAGWGGCTVHLVRSGHENALIESLRKGYYAPRFPHLTKDELNTACFATKPERGACLYVTG